MKKICIVILLGAFVPWAGCTSLLPSAKDTVKSQWTTFYDVKEAYEMIIVGKTTRDDLRKIGFDPFVTPNIEILTYLNIMQNFMPNPSIKIQDLPEGLRECIAAHEYCTGYSFHQKNVREKRKGSVMMDLFGFKRRVETTGWEFTALIVLLNDTVVYKVWGGKPSIDTTSKQKKPLGPLQSIDELVIDKAL